MTFSPEETVEQKQSRTRSQGRGSSWGLPQGVGRPLYPEECRAPFKLGHTVFELGQSPGVGDVTENTGPVTWGRLLGPLCVSVPAFVRLNEFIDAKQLGKCLAKCELLFLFVCVLDCIWVSSRVALWSGPSRSWGMWIFALRGCVVPGTRIEACPVSPPTRHHGRSRRQVGPAPTHV